MAEAYSYTDAFRGATFRDCDMRDVRIVSSFVDGLVISGFSGAAGPVVVDDVDVSEHVAAELDRRHPERVRVREARSLPELRAAWDELSGLWDETLARAGAPPESTLQERVDGEWSFVETLRHLVFAVETWVGGWLHGAGRPFSPLALPPPALPAAEWPAIGLGASARPWSAEAPELFADRRAQ